MRSQQIYRPRCSVCQYMKKHKEFRLQIMQSSYFNPDSTLSPMELVKAFGAPITRPTLYRHLQKHQGLSSLATIKNVEKLKEQGLITTTIKTIETPSDATEAHEQGLDEFIAQGRSKLARHELPISASTYLQAVKIKADIEKSTKDRRLDAMKAMFAGGGASGNVK